jgi:hypothetical protein
VSILDTFYILFESDASKLDKGLSESERKADKLTDKLKVTDTVAGNMGASLAKGLAQAAAAVLAAASVSVLTNAVMEATAAADHLDESAQRLNVGIETLSVWGDLVRKNGGSVDTFAASLDGLNSMLGQLEVTGKSRAAPFLKELGIDLENAANKGKSAMDFLPQLADAFAGLDSQKAIAIGRRLGFDQATIMTLRAGRAEVEAMIAKERELGVVTEKQGQIAAAFGDQMDDTRHAFRSVWLAVSEYVIPPLTWMAKKLQDGAVFMRKHSDLVVGLMIALGAAVATYALPPLVSMAAAAVVAFAPFIAAGALIAGVAAAFALLYEDIMVFLDGGDSMIGQVLNKWPVIGEVVRAIIGTFNDLWDVAQAVGAFFMDMWNAPGAAFDAFLGKIMDGIRALVAAVPGLSTALSAFGVNLQAPGSTEAPTGAAAPESAAGAAQRGLSKGKAAIGAASSTPMGAQTSGALTANNTKNTTVSVGKVEVKTQATDAAGISKAIGNSLESQMRQAANNFDDGVLA